MNLEKINNTSFKVLLVAGMLSTIWLFIGIAIRVVCATPVNTVFNFVVTHWEAIFVAPMVIVTVLVVLLYLSIILLFVLET